MAAQSVLEQKGDLVNYRNLTLKDLLAQLKHYNESVKKGKIMVVEGGREGRYAV